MKEPLKGKGLNLLNFLSHTKIRNRRFRRASGKALPPGAMNRLSRSLHPLKQTLIIDDIIEESPDSKTYVLKRDKTEAETPAFFRAGQYISIQIHMGESTLSRPFSLSSTPEQCIKDGIYSLTIKKCDPGFASSYIYEHWQEGDTLTSSGPSGDFYLQTLRDQRNLIFAGGGSGITPFRPLVIDTLTHYPEFSIQLIHGAAGKEDFLFYEEFCQLEKEYPQRFRYLPVAVKESRQWEGQIGFPRLELADGDLSASSLFLCGPPLMVKALQEEAEQRGMKPRQIRSESYARNLLEKGEFSGEFQVLVHQNQKTHQVKARSDESLLVALERAGLSPPSLCRSGSCGWCRARLIAGRVIPDKGPQGLRQADRKFSYIHPCSQYPASDLEIYIPETPQGR